MSHFACLGLIMVNLFDCYILDCRKWQSFGRLCKQCLCVCVPRDWFRGPKLTCTLGTHNVPQGLNTVQGIRSALCMPHAIRVWKSWHVGHAAVDALTRPETREAPHVELWCCFNGLYPIKSLEFPLYSFNQHGNGQTYETYMSIPHLVYLCEFP